MLLNSNSQYQCVVKNERITKDKCNCAYTTTTTTTTHHLTSQTPKSTHLDKPCWIIYTNIKL